MKIGLVLNPIAEASPAGLGRSVLEHARNLMRLLPEHEYVLITKDECVLDTLFPKATHMYEHVALQGDALWSTTKLLHRTDIELFIFFTPPIPILLPRRSKIVTFVHDFAFMYYESLFSRIGMWFLHTVALRRSHVVCAVSSYTAHEVSRWCKISSSRVRVVYNGCDHLVIGERNITQMSAPFFLHVGVMKERKNTLRTIKAFAQFHLKHPEYRLVLVGDTENSYGKRVRKYISEQKLNHCIEVLGFVPDATLSNLYKNTSGFVFPSLVEGFGFPILEAMAAGVPVVTSCHGALAEVAGGAAILVDPEQIDAIAEGMERLMDPLLREESIKKGYERVHYFTWQRSAEAVRDAISVFFTKEK